MEIDNQQLWCKSQGDGFEIRYKPRQDKKFEKDTPAINNALHKAAINLKLIF